MNKPILILLVLGALLLAYIVSVHADPAFKAVAENGVTIILYDEPCKLTEEVTNLPRRATWDENGKVNEGCWRYTNGTVVAYFDDKTVAAIPAQVFERVTGA